MRPSPESIIQNSELNGYTNPPLCLLKRGFTDLKFCHLASNTPLVAAEGQNV